jgi:peptidoglycan/xylan/chitin deacetylase (PgdA/CDA1 family)
MARKKIKKTVVKSKRVSRRTRSRKKIQVKINLFILGICFFLCLFVFLHNQFFNKQITYLNFSQLSPAKIHNYAKNFSIIPTPLPTFTPTPTPAIEIKQQPVLNGFCLNVPVLMYHHVQPENSAIQLGQKALTVDNTIFEQQMKYLSEQGYTTLFANELTNALISHTGLPAKSVVIMADDGYADFYYFAEPALQKYNLKANVAIISGLMNTGDMLTWDQVKALKSNNNIYFTNHTWSHYALGHGNAAKIESEITTAQNQIQQYTGQNVNEVTYPFGSFGDTAISILQKLGYQSGFTEIPGHYQCDSFLMTLHRTRVGNSPLSSYGL